MLLVMKNSMSEIQINIKHSYINLSLFKKHNTIRTLIVLYQILDKIKIIVR